MTAITPADADRAILSHITPLPAQTLPLRQCHGRILQQAVKAERDNPPFDRVCMDGIALASSACEAGTRSFRIQGIQAAGAVPLTLAAPGNAIEVMTGAVLPHGTNCVIPVEQYVSDADVARLNADATAAPWRNVQRRGSDSPPGIDLLHAGMRLGASEIAVAASAGLASLVVSRQPRIMVISTGDELVEPGHPIADHQIRRSNAYAVAAALRLHGYDCVDDLHLPDHAATMQRRLGELLEAQDVLVLSGGVSKGRFDFVPAVLKKLGVAEVFSRVAQRPGQPLWFGVGQRGQLVFGLPGNPVSTLICLARYVLPALRATVRWVPTAPERVALAQDAAGRGMTFFMPVALLREHATTVASARPTNGSGDFFALAGTDGFVELQPLSEGHPAGSIADFYPW